MACAPDNESRFARTGANLAHFVPAPTLGFGDCLQFRLDLPGGERPGYAGKPPGGCRFSVHKRVSVVVDVGFAQMLSPGILVGLVLMVDRGMAVLVIVSVHHVLPVRPVTMVVNDVIVLMNMHDGVMMMHRHCSSTPIRASVLRRQCSQVPGPPTGSKVMSCRGAPFSAARGSRTGGCAALRSAAARRGLAAWIMPRALPDRPKGLGTRGTTALPHCSRAAEDQA
jgi:hypothetical protein